MSSLPVKTSCPLGHTCEQIDGDVINRCVSYIEVEGINPLDGQQTKSWGCGLFHWQPIFMLENARTNRGQTAALESFRNETVKGQREFNLLSRTNLLSEQTNRDKKIQRS